MFPVRVRHGHLPSSIGMQTTAPELPISPPLLKRIRGWCGMAPSFYEKGDEHSKTPAHLAVVEGPTEEMMRVLKIGKVGEDRGGEYGERFFGGRHRI